MTEYVFGYGSLLSPESAARTLGRPVIAGRSDIVLLDGYRRVWGYATAVRFHEDPPCTVTPAVFLDLRPEPAATCNGLLIAVSSDELALLDRRERGYSRLDVTGAIAGGAPGTVYAYRATDGFRSEDHGTAQVVISERYLRSVERALSHWGPDVRATFDRTTKPPQFPLRDGPYSFAHPDQERAASRGGE